MNDTIDLRISGCSAMAGGEYGKVHISGSGQINGNLKCDSLHCSGAAKILGDVVTEEISCSGAVKMDGSLTCNKAMRISGSGKCTADTEVETMSVSGSFKTEGALKAKEIKVSGSLSVEKSIQCEQLKVSGKLHVNEGVEAEMVCLSGSTEITGLLNAEEIEIDNSGVSRIGDIGCTTIRVRLHEEKTSWFGIFSNRRNRPSLEVGTIEGDQVELIKTRAKVVRGRDVVIGPGCIIDRVEYTNSCQAEEGTVKEQVKA